jgi:hypothetical protein
LADFITLLTYLDYISGFSTESAVIDILEGLAINLPQLYEKAWNLPTIEDNDVDVSFTSGEYIHYFTQEQIIEAYLDYRIDLIKISDSLNNLYNKWFHLNDFNENADPGEVAGRIDEWKRTFEIENGWGEEILKLLLHVHKSIYQIKLLTSEEI